MQFYSQSNMDSQGFSKIASQTLEQPVQKIKVKIGTGPVIMDGGFAMQSLPVKNASDAFTASLLMMMKHCADVHLTILEIISEKYNLDIDDICESVKEHPNWKQLHVEPIIHDLTQIARETVYKNPEPVETKKKEKKETVKKPVQKPKAKPKIKEIIYE